MDNRSRERLKADIVRRVKSGEQFSRIASAVGIAESTIYSWRKSDQKFNALIERAMVRSSTLAKAMDQLGHEASQSQIQAEMSHLNPYHPDPRNELGRPGNGVVRRGSTQLDADTALQNTILFETLAGDWAERAKFAESEDRDKCNAFAEAYGHLADLYEEDSESDAAKLGEIADDWSNWQWDNRHDLSEQELNASLQIVEGYERLTREMQPANV